MKLTTDCLLHTNTILCLLICLFICVIFIATIDYTASCWIPTNKVLCQNKPQSGNVIQNIVTSDICVDSICYNGYSKLIYDGSKYCFITLFENQIVSNDTAYYMANDKYFIGEKVYIHNIDNDVCSEYQFQKSKVITALFFLIFSVVIIFLLCGCISYFSNKIYEIECRGNKRSRYSIPSKNSKIEYNKVNQNDTIISPLNVVIPERIQDQV